MIVKSELVVGGEGGRVRDRSVAVEREDDVRVIRQRRGQAVLVGDREADTVVILEVGFKALEGVT